MSKIEGPSIVFLPTEDGKGYAVATHHLPKVSGVFEGPYMGLVASVRAMLAKNFCGMAKLTIHENGKDKTHDLTVFASPGKITPS